MTKLEVHCFLLLCFLNGVLYLTELKYKRVYILEEKIIMHWMWTNPKKQWRQMSGQVVFGTTSQLFSSTCLLSSASVTQFASQSFPSHTCCLLPLTAGLRRFPFPDSFSWLYSTPLRPHVYFRVKKWKNERNINYKIVLLNYLHLQGLHMDNSHHANILYTSLSSSHW